MDHRSTTSVVICAYTLERWNELLAAVQSLRQQVLQPDEIIIVIDHNPQLSQKVRACIPDVLLVENTGSKGLSDARNAGVAASTGSLIAFLDDDAIAQPDWLSKLQQCCEQDGVLGAGSKVNPAWSGPKPVWFPDEFGWVLGYSYTGLPHQVTKVRNFFGTGMCIRRDVFKTVGGFRNGIGRVNKIPLGCEETELCIRALQQIPGGSFLYDPGSMVDHKIHASRMNWAYFRSRCYSEGVSKAVVSRFVGANDGLSSERSYTLRILPGGVVRGVGDAFRRGDWSGLQRSFAILLGFSLTVAGYMSETIKHQGAKLINSIRPKKTYEGTVQEIQN